MSKQKSKKNSISDSDLVGFTLDEMLTETYGPKDSASRIEVEKKIDAIAKTLGTKKTQK